MMGIGSNFFSIERRTSERKMVDGILISDLQVETDGFFDSKKIRRGLG